MLAPNARQNAHQTLYSTKYEGTIPSGGKKRRATAPPPPFPMPPPPPQLPRRLQKASFEVTCSHSGLVCLLSLLAAIFKTNQPKLVCLIVIVKIIIKTNQQKLVCLIVIVKIIILLLLLLITFFVQEFGKTKQCREHLSTPTVSPMSGKATIRNSTS